MPKVAAEEEDEGQVLRKLKPKIPNHNDAHPVAENMKLRNDAGLGSGDCQIHMPPGGGLLWITCSIQRNSRTSMRPFFLTRSP